ncbi:killer cell lectin-like receptor subfamily B member 1B allele B, partial [Hypanus sabinus]|uniref:killer cell lectin-like receptor subfamily B member 1B allele B n=1 Tax=Hypanus sabinus TaxID=79690 RepID=UPI0028C4C709
SQTSTDSESIFGKDESLIDEAEDPPIAPGHGELRVTAQTDSQTSTDTELNIGKDEPLVHEGEDPPIASGPGELRLTAQTAAHEQQSKVKIGNRPYRLICLLCLVTSALIVIVVGLSIHGMHSDLRHQFTEMETKYRSVNETKAQICELLTSRREQTCSKDWMKNKDRCYYVSTFEASFRQAMEECSNRDSRLLEINSRDEASFASNKLLYRNIALWIGKCENGTVGMTLLYNVSPWTSNCRDCEAYLGSYPCDRDRRFICEKSAPLFPDIPEEIQGLCQQPEEAM